MNKFTALKNVFVLLLLIGGVFLVGHYAEPVKTMLLGMMNIQDDSVLGASSVRADSINGKITADVNQQVMSAKDQLFHLNVGDVVDGFSRVQKIPQDVHSLVEFSANQITHVLQSTK